MAFLGGRNNGSNNNNNNAFSALNAQLFRTNVRYGAPGSPKTFSTTSPLESQPGGDIEAARRRTLDARQGEQRIQNAGQYGTIGSLLGGIAGTLIPVPILGPALGSAAGGAIGQALGGVTPDLGDIVGYGASGALGGVAGQGVGQMAGQAATSGLGAMMPYVMGQGALGGLGNLVGMNTQYDPRHRYYWDTTSEDVQSAFNLFGGRR
jgi:hypothetical protein